MKTMKRGWVQNPVVVAGCRIDLQRAGEGPPLLVLPDDTGVPGWLPLHEELAREHELILLSHPGFGRSERPDWARNLRDLAAIEMAVLRAARIERPAVVGFGLGGWMAAEMAAQSGPCFSRMILAAPFGLRPASGEIYDQFLGRGPAYVRAGFATAGAFEATYGAEPDLDTIEAWEINREMTARVAWSPYLFNPALPHLLPLIDIPALVVWGSEDGIIPPAEAERWARLLPNVRAEVIAGAGHRLDVEGGPALASLMREFLRG